MTPIPEEIGDNILKIALRFHPVNETKFLAFIEGAEQGYSLAADRIKELEKIQSDSLRLYECQNNAVIKRDERIKELEGLVSYFSTISANIHFPNAEKQHEYNAKLREARKILNQKEEQ